MTNIVFLHGFLGTPRDWTPFQEHFSQRCKCLSPSLLEIDDLFSFGSLLPQNSHLVGYSMGGRLALWLHHLFPGKFSSLTCISSNPGLEEGREERLAQDQIWIDEMRTLSTSEFINKWYKNPIFHNCLIPDERNQIDLIAWASILQKFTIAKQPNFWNDLPMTKAPILFLFGGNDMKYNQMANRLNAMGKLVRAHIVEDVSHTVHLEAPRQCIRQMEEYVICN